MKRIILTTCGTSLLTSNCWNGISGNSAVVALQGEEKYEHEGLYQRFAETNKKELVNLFDRGCWDDTSQIAKLPAELASLRTIKKFCDRHNINLSENDRLILMYADNEDAIFCTEIIFAVLNKYRLFGNIQIEKRKIDGLDPMDSREFESALETLWNKLRDMMPFSEENDAHYYLNLTGGYKALVMLFSCFGYVKGIADTHIFYLNERAGENILVMGFDSDDAIEGFSKLKQGYIEPQTGELISTSLQPREF
jgi:putative CRISPR-associated protein (TIGR02619 family)